MTNIILLMQINSRRYEGALPSLQVTVPGSAAPFEVLVTGEVVGPEVVVDPTA